MRIELASWGNGYTATAHVLGAGRHGISYQEVSGIKPFPMNSVGAFGSNILSERIVLSIHFVTYDTVIQGNNAVSYGKTREVWCSLDTLLLLFSILPMLWALRFCVARKRVQAQTNLCRKCGYDLRATPARCPECGDVPRR